MRVYSRDSRGVKLKVRSTDSAAATGSAPPRPNCHATTVTVTAPSVRGGNFMKESVSSSILAGPERTKYRTFNPAVDVARSRIDFELVRTSAGSATST